MQRLDRRTWHIEKSNKFCKVLLKTTPLPLVLWIVGLAQIPSAHVSEAVVMLEGDEQEYLNMAPWAHGAGCSLKSHWFHWILELLWNSFGTPLELLWNSFGTP